RDVRLDAQRRAVSRAISLNEQRTSALLDMRLDGALDDGAFRSKQAKLLDEHATLLLRRRELESAASDTFQQVERLVRLGAGAKFAFHNGSDEEKREVLATVLCYLQVSDRNIASYQYKRPFDVLKKDPEGAFCLAWSG
ncbi:MAG: hypothetical protein Q7W16_04820, partial [Coriobacteriia bacterium]|nr:hypothetical protein [Coriobacteriia bacterium]